jgi:hypothetical protein
VIIRAYAPISDAPLAFARIERVIIELDADGKHCHAFRGTDGVFRVAYRDVEKGRISEAQCEELNRLLSKG